MAVLTAPPVRALPPSRAVRRVAACYSLFDAFFPKRDFDAFE